MKQMRPLVHAMVFSLLLVPYGAAAPVHARAETVSSRKAPKPKKAKKSKKPKRNKVNRRRTTHA